MNSSLLTGLGRGWWLVVTYGAIAILFGLYSLIWPEASIVASVLAKRETAIMRASGPTIGAFRTKRSQLFFPDSVLM